MSFCRGAILTFLDRGFAKGWSSNFLTNSFPAMLPCLPGSPKPERGQIRQNRPFTKPCPFHQTFWPPTLTWKTPTHWKVSASKSLSLCPFFLLERLSCQWPLNFGGNSRQPILCHLDHGPDIGAMLQVKPLVDLTKRDARIYSS